MDVALSESPGFGGMGNICKPKIKIKFLHICTFGLPRFIILIGHVDIDFGIRQMESLGIYSKHQEMETREDKKGLHKTFKP